MLIRRDVRIEELKMMMLKAHTNVFRLSKGLSSNIGNMVPNPEIALNQKTQITNCSDLSNVVLGY